MNASKLVKAGQGNGMELVTGLAEWRLEHPRATFEEIEKEVDRRLESFRVKLLEEAASMSEVREWQRGAGGPRCPECGELLVKRGRHRRVLETHGGKGVELARE
jgi:hypothetical protein